MSRYKIQAFLFVFVAFMLGCNEYMIVGVLPQAPPAPLLFDGGLLYRQYLDGLVTQLCQPAFVQNPVSHDSRGDYFPDPGYRQLRGSLGKKEPRFSPGFLPASRLLPSSACQSGPLSQRLFPGMLVSG